MATIILFGKNGMLGRYINSYLSDKYEIIGFDRNDYDVLDNKFENLCKLLEQHKNKQNVVVINAIGLILPTKVKEYEKYLLVNSLFPNMLSIICKYHNWKLIQPSTDCVFDGNKTLYTESDTPDEPGIYGQSKSFGEPSYGSTIRVSIIGEEITHKYSLIEWVKSNKGKEINGYTNHFWNGITCLEYAKIIDKMISNNIFWNGVRHLYAPRVVSKHELVEMINNHFNLEIKINKFATTNVCDKTLSSNYPELNNLFNIPDLDDQIKELSTYELK